VNSRIVAAGSVEASDVVETSSAGHEGAIGGD
jgi:hypothetical protein